MQKVQAYPKMIFRT